jgi:AraC family transcriptional regulator
MNKALGYIEDNLDAEIDYAMLAHIAACSQYHFQRFFASVTDIPLSEYIRRRRLTQAALELQNTDARIIDIALKYGYQSPDAFARAFTVLQGMAPSKARDKGIVLKAYPRLTFALSIKGVAAMNYRIEEKKAFRAVGVRERFSTEDSYQLQEIPKMWDRVNSDGSGDAVYALMEGDMRGCLGICADMADNGLTYWIAVATRQPCPSSLSEMTVPASTWAVFEVIGPMPKAMQEMWGRIFAEWFPTSGYDHAKTPELELYCYGDIKSPAYRSEIWIPVVKK